MMSSQAQQCSCASWGALMTDIAVRALNTCSSVTSKLATAPPEGITASPVGCLWRCQPWELQEGQLTVWCCQWKTGPLKQRHRPAMLSSCAAHSVDAGIARGCVAHCCLRRIVKLFWQLVSCCVTTVMTASSWPAETRSASQCEANSCSSVLLLRCETKPKNHKADLAANAMVTFRQRCFCEVD